MERLWPKDRRLVRRHQQGRAAAPGDAHTRAGRRIGTLRRPQGISGKHLAAPAFDRLRNKQQPADQLRRAPVEIGLIAGTRFEARQEYIDGEIPEPGRRAGCK